MSLEKEIEDFMNSKVCRDALRTYNDKEFSKYLARQIVKIIRDTKE